MEMEMEVEYKQLILDILNQPFRQTRNSRTKSVFGRQFEYDLSKGFMPILTGRKIFYKGVFGEMAAFLRQPKTLKDFEVNGCNYWELWAKKDGSINIDYGNAWFDFNGVNQVQKVVDSLRNDPYGRRHIISGWNPANIDNLDLPCCHYCYQFYVTDDGKLDLIWIQRSVDVMIGLPANFILASVLNMLMAQTVGLKVGKIILQLGDCHIYEEHIDGAQEYLSRAILGYPLVFLHPDSTIFNFYPQDIEVLSYHHGDPIKFKLEA
jgi:thymidylate synthase